MGAGRRQGGQHFRAATRQRRRAGTILAVVAAVALAVASLLAFGPSAHGSAVRTAGAPRHNPAGAGRGGQPPQSNLSTAPGASTAVTSVGPNGVVSSAIAAENARPGTTAWRITAEPPSGFTEGFADRTYAAPGDTVTLYVSTSARWVAAYAYRMGWYGGAGGRLVWSSPAAPGVHQPTCPLDRRTNTVSCDNWAPTVKMPISAAFPQGDYLVKLVGNDGSQGYVVLTVWDPSSTAAYLVMSRSLTEEGWNTYGGYSFYTGEGPCILGQLSSYPQCNRARAVSFDRPDAINHGASDFLSNEFPLVELVERDGLDVAYCSDVTADQHPSILARHRAVLSLGHDETWTYHERQGAEAAYRHGVNFFFGAAAVLRHSRLEPSPLGPGRIEVDYRDSSEDPLDGSGDRFEVTGNTWASPPSAWSEVPFTGQEYSGYLDGSDSAPLVIYDSSSWIFAGTGLADGSKLDGVVMSDFDHLDAGRGSPADVEVLAHSPVPLSRSFSSLGGWNGYTYSDMTYYTDADSGAGVFDAGTVNWIYALTPCATDRPACPAGTVATITENILRVFGQGPARAGHPSVANWRSVSPYGS